MSTKEHPPGAAFRLAIDLVHLVLPRARWADRLWFRLRFFIHHGRPLSGEMRFNDALMRQVLDGGLDAPLVRWTTHKLGGKQFLRLVAGPEHVVPTLAHLRTRREIDAFDFPKTCVMKGTTTSGQVVCRLAGEPVNRRRLKRWLGHNHDRVVRETNYAGMPNSVIVEPLIGSGGLADDLKMTCRDGRVRWITYDTVEGTAKSRRIFDRDWRLLPVGKALPATEGLRERPARLGEMVAAAERVAAYFGMVRVDFYLDGPDWWFGEITHFDGAALSGFVPPEGERIINELTFGEAAFAGPYGDGRALGARPSRKGAGVRRAAGPCA